MGYKVYLGQKSFTVDITDRRRAELAYNVLYAMANNGARYESENGQTEIPARELIVMDSEGNSFTPKLDPEWNEYPLKEHLAWKESRIQGQIDEAMKNGEEISRSVAERRAFLEQYGPVVDDGDINNVRVGVDSWDYDKAVETFDFLKYGLDPSAGISIKDVDEDKKNFLLHGNDPVSEDDYTSYLSLSGHDIFFADSFDVKPIGDNPEWAKGEMGNSEEFEDFADAVAGISEDGPTMEQ